MGMCCKKNAMIGWRNAQSMKYRPRGPQTERKTRGPGKVVGNDCQARKLNKEDAMDRSIDEVDKGCLMNRKGVSGWMFLLVPAYPGSPEQQSLTTVRHCQSKEASLLWSHHEETRKLPEEITQGRPRTAWMDNIKMWTRLPVEESIRMTEINGESTSMVWPTLRSRMAEEQNSTLIQHCSCKLVYSYFL